jgi:hypothetical protein
VAQRTLQKRLSSLVVLLGLRGVATSMPPLIGFGSDMCVAPDKISEEQLAKCVSEGYKGKNIGMTTPQPLGVVTCRFSRYHSQ